MEGWKGSEGDLHGSDGRSHSSVVCFGGVPSSEGDDGSSGSQHGCKG